jgi:hypothetical protein
MGKVDAMEYCHNVPELFIIEDVFVKDFHLLFDVDAQPI